MSWQFTEPNATLAWLFLTSHERGWPPAAAALPSADGDPRMDQTQAAPKIQAGAMKVPCSENKLLATLKAWGTTIFLACRQTWGGTSPKIWNRNMGLRTNLNTRLPKSIYALLHFWLPVWNIHSPNLRAKAAPVRQSHSMNIWSKPLEEKGQIIWNHR